MNPVLTNSGYNDQKCPVPNCSLRLSLTEYNFFLSHSSAEPQKYPLKMKQIIFFSFTGRSLEARQVERFGILKIIEDSLQRYAEVEKSHECLVRTICEVAHTPVSGDGILVTSKTKFHNCNCRMGPLKMILKFLLSQKYLPFFKSSFG